ncbi:MAG: hypothetical protein ACJ0OY_04260 [Dehalococcoidia bacterium]
MKNIIVNSLSIMVLIVFYLYVLLGLIGGGVVGYGWNGMIGAIIGLPVGAGFGFLIGVLTTGWVFIVIQMRDLLKELVEK